MPSSHLILCRPLLLLPPIPPSIRVFSNESTLRMRWPKYWSFSYSIILSKEIPGLISFRMDWFDLLAVQGTLKSLLQHHSSKALIHIARIAQVPPCSGIRRSISCLFWSIISVKLCWFFRAILRNLIPRNLILGVFIRMALICRLEYISETSQGS